MQDVRDQKTEKSVRDFIDKNFPRGSSVGTNAAMRLDIRRPNLHDTKEEFLAEIGFVIKSADDLFALYRGLVGQADPSVETARGLPADFILQARENAKQAEALKSATDLAIDSLRRADYWQATKRYVFELYLNFSKRRETLEEQRETFWSTKGRPPDHYARVMALRLARLYVEEHGVFPTVGTASDGDHPSTEYCRLVEELFGLLGISTGFRLPTEWAVDQLGKSDFSKRLPSKLEPIGLQPNLGKWGAKN